MAEKNNIPDEEKMFPSPYSLEPYRSADADKIENIDNLRGQIDVVDRQILELLAERMRLSKQIGEVKSKISKPPLDAGRWQEVINSRIEQGKGLGLDDIFVVTIYNAIHEESLNIQKNTKNER